MKVDKELIEKYHLGLCSAEETKAVENWLLNDEAEQEVVLSKSEDKNTLKNEMWANISAQMPEIQEQEKIISLHDYLTPTFWRAIAATLLVGVAFTLFWKRNGQAEIAEINQTEFPAQIVEEEMNILLGKKSKAEFNPLSNKNVDGNIDFCGTIRIDPKQDIELTIHGTCESSTHSSEKMFLKKGQTYIAVNYQFDKEDELIVMDERELINLPPMMQREIMKQFPI